MILIAKLRKVDCFENISRQKLKNLVVDPSASTSTSKLKRK